MASPIFSPLQTGPHQKSSYRTGRFLPWVHNISPCDKVIDPPPLNVEELCMVMEVTAAQIHFHNEVMGEDG